MTAAYDLRAQSRPRIGEVEFEKLSNTIAIEINASLHEKAATAVKILTANQKSFADMIAKTHDIKLHDQESKS